MDPDPADFGELVSSLRRLIDAWLEAGGEPHDDAIIGFYGIESQVNDIDRDGPTRNEEDEDFYRFFYLSFSRERDELRKLIEGSPAAG